MSDKRIPMHKEIAMGIASKKEVSRDPTVKIQNKKCGGVVKKSTTKTKK